MEGKKKVVYKKILYGDNKSLNISRFTIRLNDVLIRTTKQYYKRDFHK